ncbi:hypothetical protein Q8A64_06530 [Oxalobacteraceae bacterium R-40]|uniref:Uncharacterized protein n=1 Tax=Keguizhuia sedimenti TaxID=3064264 RepID=A0ABU1BMF1_9BURK|nr:hypothetical protein [Oxalobacteraceae bacterium R-40]
MNRIFRTLLIWLIIAALPMQATAAVVKASCGSAHHPAQMQNSFAGHAPAADVPHHEHASMDAHHAHADQASVHGEFADDVLSVNATADAQTSLHQTDQDHSTCSACAACCVGAVAPPPAHLKAPDFSQFKTSGIGSSKLLTGFIPAGLERPPRFFLA